MAMEPTRRYVLDGQTPVAEPDVFRWARWFETVNRRVDVTDLGACVVSTVFLGIDHQYRDGGPPLLFETLVSGGPADGDMERTSTWETAKDAHTRMVLAVRSLS
jgi:hypothetical protein